MPEKEDIQTQENVESPAPEEAEVSLAPEAPARPDPNDPEQIAFQQQLAEDIARSEALDLGEPKEDMEPSLEVQNEMSEPTA